MELCNVPPHVSNLFSIVGLNRVFAYHLSEEAAIYAIQEMKRVSKIKNTKLRRRFMRITSTVDIEYKEKFSKPPTFYKAKIINLGADGVFVLAKKVFTVGDLLSLRIHLLPKPGIVELEAKVVWLSDPEMQPEEFPGMGLEFHNLDGEKQKQIIDFIEKNQEFSSQG